MTEEKQKESAEIQAKVEIEAGVCFVCHGVGHWAREVGGIERVRVVLYLLFNSAHLFLEYT